jgi:hypothetical protein
VGSLGKSEKATTSSRAALGGYWELEMWLVSYTPDYKDLVPPPTIDRTTQ